MSVIVLVVIILEIMTVCSDLYKEHCVDVKMAHSNRNLFARCSKFEFVLKVDL